MNIILKRSLAFILSFVIVFSSTSVLAASPAGWATSPADIVIGGIQTTVTALKGSGSSALKSVITHAPSPATVGKTLLKGASGAALLFAITQQLGDAVDYVLDPANNRVKYAADAAEVEAGSLDAECKRISMKAYGTTEGASFGYYETSAKDRMVCNSKYGPNGWFAVPKIPASAYERYIPISGGSSNNNLADAVIANAASGHAPSQDAVKAAIIESVNTGALDTELQASAVPVGGSTGGSTGGTVTNPDGSVTNPDGSVTNPDGSVTNPDGSVTNPDGTVTDPVVPADPSGVIAAIKSLASTLGAKFTSITNAIGITNTKLDDIADANAEAAKDAKDATDAKAAKDAEFTDWATAEPEPLDPNTTLDIDVPSVLPVDTDINFGGSCPANFEVNSSIFGNPINIVLLDSSKFCGFLSTFVKFPVYAVSSLFALYILGGRKDV